MRLGERDASRQDGERGGPVFVFHRLRRGGFALGEATRGGAPRWDVTGGRSRAVGVGRGGDVPGVPLALAKSRRVRVAPSILLLRGCRRRPRGGRRFAPALHLFVVAESLDELAGRLDLGEVRAFELDGRHRPSLHLRRESGVRGRERANPRMPKQQRHFKISATHLAGVVVAVGGRFAARREVGSREPVSRPRARRDVVVRAFHRQRRSSAGQRVCSASVKPAQPLRTSDRSARRRVLVLVFPPHLGRARPRGEEIRRRGGRIGARGVRERHAWSRYDGFRRGRGRVVRSRGARRRRQGAQQSGGAQFLSSRSPSFALRLSVSRRRV